MAKSKKVSKIFQIDELVAKYEQDSSSDFQNVGITVYGSIGSINIDFYSYKDNQGKIHAETKAHAKKLHGQLNVLQAYIEDMQAVLETIAEI
jgi:hypothetical protein